MSLSKQIVVYLKPDGRSGSPSPLVVVFFFFLIAFFGILLTIFSCVSIFEGVAISDGVISFGVQDATHVFNVVILSGLGKLP